MAPGNVVLSAGEGRLQRRCVANVNQIQTIDRSRLGPKIGTLSVRRIREIVDGIRLALEPSDVGVE
jgi:mRNA interferase MazF